MDFSSIENAEPAAGTSLATAADSIRPRPPIHINVFFRPNDAVDVHDVLQKIASAFFCDTRRTSLLERCDSEHWNRDRCGLLPWLNKL